MKRRAAVRRRRRETLMKATGRNGFFPIIRRASALGLAALLFFLTAAPAGRAVEEAEFTSPETLRPYAAAGARLRLPADGLLSLYAVMGGEEIPLFRERPLAAGDVTLELDGLSLAGEPLPRGAGVLRARLEAGSNSREWEAPVQVLPPAAALSFVVLSSVSLPVEGGDDLYAEHQLTRPGRLLVALYRADDRGTALRTWSLDRGDALPRRFRWDRTLKGGPAEPGDYVLTFQVQGSPQGALERAFTLTGGKAPSLPIALTAAGDFLPESLDDESVWAAMTAPITVVDIGDLQHQSIYSAPDAQSSKLGMVHGQTAGLTVLDLGAGDFAKIRAARHGDGEWVTGYVPLAKLKTVVPDSRFGVLVDKGAQMLTVYREGRKIGSLPVSTGVYVPPGTDSFDTVPGAFLTQDRIASFDSEGFRYDHALRIDGGNLIHQTGYRTVSGLPDFSGQRPNLGQKASHGCVRVDNRVSAEGLNAWWLYANLPPGTKVLVLPETAGSAVTADAHAETASPSPAPSASPEPADTATTPAFKESAPLPTDPPPARTGDVLRLGSEGPQVVLARSLLAGLGYLDSGEGGFDGQMQDAVKAFQKENRLSADGVIGRDTWAALTDPGARAKAVLPPATGAPPPPDKVRIVMTFGGDSVLGSEEGRQKKPESFHSAVEEKGMGWPYSGLAAILQGDDLTQVNLENVLKDSAKALEKRMHNFRGPTAFADILRQGSVELVNLANNHFVDYGQDGRTSTRRALTRAGVSYSGYGSLHVFEKDGVRIGFAGIRETIYHQRRQRIAEEIAALRAEGCRYVVYTLHFGNEYEPRHNELQTQMAREAVDAGADLVIGHHPHVVQGIEEYGKGLIAYSLGNLVFGGNLELSTFDGLLLQVTLDFDRGELLQTQARLIPILTSGAAPANDFRPVVAQGSDKERILEAVRSDSAKPYPEEFILGQVP